MYLFINILFMFIYLFIYIFKFICLFVYYSLIYILCTQDFRFHYETCMHTKRDNAPIAKSRQT